MSLWNSTPSTTINSVNYGVSANDGSGDNLRDAFIKVDQNFGNVATWLSGTFPEFQNANVDGAVTAQWANVYGVTVSTLVGGNVSTTGSNIGISANLIPTGPGTVDLGSATVPFRNLYVQATVATSQLTQSSDAGILKIHANALVGDVQDTGILGNISSDYGGANTYAFFGHQYTTNNFIYKITHNDATKGNSVVYDGIYGNAQLGSLFLSNATTSTSTNTNAGTLIVNGDAGIAGNVNLGGNVTATGAMYAQGYQVVTTGIIGNYGTPYTGGVIAGNTVFLSGSVSNNANTGAVSIPYGGLGVYGNVFSATGFVSQNFYGTIQTANQPNITGLGTIQTLNAITGGFTSLGTTGLTTTGLVNLTGPTLNITSNTSITSYANVAAGLIVGANAWVGGNLTVINNTYLSSATVANAVTVGTATTLTNTFTGINSSSAITIDSFSSTVYGSAKYLIQIVDTGYTPNKVETVEMSMTHDRNGSSTLVYINTYGVVSNQGNTSPGLGSFIGTYSSGSIRLQYTPNYTPSSMAIKVLRTAITL